MTILSRQGESTELIHPVLKRSSVQRIEAELGEWSYSSCKGLVSRANRNEFHRIRALEFDRIRVTPMRCNRLTGPCWAFLIGGLITDREDKIHLWRV